MEIWKPVKGYDDLYEVSNLSKIKQLETGRILKQSTHVAGYKVATLRNNKGRKIFYVHRIIAEAFIPNPYNKPQVNHKNGMKFDNRLDNLEWVTHKENLIHCHKNGMGNCKSGEDHHNSVLKNKQVEEIRWLYASGKYTIKDLSTAYNCSIGTIQRIKNNDTYKVEEITQGGDGSLCCNPCLTIKFMRYNKSAL